MPSVSVSRLIAAPRDDVWAALSDIAGARRWNASWSKIDITSPQTHGAGTTFRAHTEGDETYDFEVTEWSAPERIAFSPVHGEGEHYAVMLKLHAFSLQPTEDGGTRVELTARASAHGIMGRLVAMFFWPGHQKQGLSAALDAVQAIFEPPDKGLPEPAGEETAPTTD